MKIAHRSSPRRHRPGALSRLLLAGAVIGGVLAVILASTAPVAGPTPAPARSAPAVTCSAPAAARTVAATAAERPGLHHTAQHAPLEGAVRKLPVLRTIRNLSSPGTAQLPRGGTSMGAQRARLAGLDYIVRPGDTLSAIARRFGGPYATWQWLYGANRSRISDPDLIHPGETVSIPDKPGGHGSGWAVGPGAAYPPDTALSGTLRCAGLETLWERVGGAPSHAVIAASIAMAESSGNQYATGTAGERGYWQIHPDHGALSTYDPQGNARAAVLLSSDGTDWSPWTTYTSGAYMGRCSR